MNYLFRNSFLLISSAILPKFRNFQLPLFFTNVFKMNNFGLMSSLDEAILRVSTFRRKKSKLKREKRNQRRKKLRRLSEKKREKKNY